MASPVFDSEDQNPDQHSDEFPDQNSAQLPRALKSGGANSPALRRGEVFDFDLEGEANGDCEIEGQNQAKSRAVAWFFAGVAALFCAYNLGATIERKSKTPTPVTSLRPQKEKLAPLRVQVAGKVKKPGVYTLPGGARLEDAIQQAGGALPNADLSGLNLAAWVIDGSKIEIPTRVTGLKSAATARAPARAPAPVATLEKGFVTPLRSAPEAKSPATSRVDSDSDANPVTAPDPATKSRDVAAKPRDKTRSGGKSAPETLAALRRNPVDLNRAGVEQLSLLPGVGPKMAERILVYRRDNGGFKSVAELDNVKGIGEKRMAVLQTLVKVK